MQICRDLEKENITNKGQKFIPQTLRHFLQRKLYTSEYEINGKQYNNIYPQIITNELFTKVKERMDKNRYGCRKDNHEIFRLKDKIFCGYCNKKMYPVSAISSNGQHLRYYNCIGRKKDKCENKIMYKDFIEGVIDKFLIEQFNTPKNLEILTEKILEVHKKRMSSNTSLTTLKSDLQKVNTAIANIMSAIEKGIFTETTKARLEELEKTKKELQEEVIIEQSKEKYELTKEDIQDFFKYTMKQCPEKCFELFIKFVRVYENKIEIGINYAVNHHRNVKQQGTGPVNSQVHRQRQPSHAEILIFFRKVNAQDIQTAAGPAAPESKAYPRAGNDASDETGRQGVLHKRNGRDGDHRQEKRLAEHADQGAEKESLADGTVSQEKQRNI